MSATTAESLAAEHGVDEKTIRRDALHHDVGEQLLLVVANVTTSR
jgi:HD superfamily phosphodiesterase